LPTILKGPRDKKKLMEPSGAHQMFGRAGRPQFDDQGYVYALAHEDDVKLLRWKEKYDQIPEDTKDPGLMRAKKQLKKKMPKRRQGETYWTAEQFEKLRTAPSANLVSKGPLPWRYLAYMLEQNPDVQPLRDLVGRRLMDDRQRELAQTKLNEMLVTLWTAGYLDLDPKPKPKSGVPKPQNESGDAEPAAPKLGLLEAAGIAVDAQPEEPSDDEPDDSDASRGFELKDYKPLTATPNERADRLIQLRSVNPLYGVYAAGHLAIADMTERIEAFESMLDMPGSVARYVHVPPLEEHPQGPLANGRLNGQLLDLGLASAEELTGPQEDDEDKDGRNYRSSFEDRPPRPLTLGEKLKRLFDHDFPRVHDVSVRSVWVVGELVQFDCDFNKYIRAHGLQKHEGILFRHVLRFIMLLDEMASIPPAETTVETWEDPLDELADRLTKACQAVDPESAEELTQGSSTDDLTTSQPLRRTPKN
jgi:hypothetical protein